jgi:DNA mismatch repair ATPase MutS
MPNKQECTFTSVAPYPKVRQLAHGLKDGKQESIEKAAEMMTDNIKVMAAGKYCVLVPIPNHHGKAVYTKALAEELSRRTGIPTWDILFCRPHMPLHYAKKNDLKPEGIYLKLSLYRQVPRMFTPIIIDNVLDTGYTAGAAIKAIGHPDTMLAVLGHTKNHQTNKNYQFNQLTTNMEKKQVQNKNDTPLKQFEYFKGKHPDTLILMRNGDKYRAMNEDAQKLSDVLGIETKKPRLKQDGSLIAEFPYNKLDVCLPKLIRAGNRIAIVDMPVAVRNNQKLSDNMKKKTEPKKEETKTEKAEVKAETPKVDKQTKVEKPKEKVAETTDKQSEEQKETKRREPQMVTVNGEKVTHGHAFQSNLNPDKWYFTARLDGNQLRPQLMKPEDVAAYQKRETTIEALMQNYYPTKLQKKVTPEEFKADNKLSDGRVIDRMVVYKEHDESRDDVGKYKIYTQVGNQKMSRTMSHEDLNAYFDRVTTPAKLVEKNFAEQLHMASFYNQFKLEDGVKEVKVAKQLDGQWAVSADLGEKGQTSKHILSWHDKQALFSAKTATKEQLAARYLNNEIKELKAEKVSAKQSFKR